MVQILPRFDPGGEIGRSIGSGIGSALSVQADRSRMLSALDSLKDLDKPVEYEGEGGEMLTRDPTFSEKLQTLVKAGAGIPGWMNVVEKLAPSLMQQAKGQAAKESLPMGEDREVRRPQDIGYVREGQDDKLPVPERLQRLENQLLQFENNALAIPEELTSEVPRFNRSAPAYHVPTREDLRNAFDNYIKAGRSEDEAFSLLQKDMQLQAQGFESQMKGYLKDLNEFKNRRGLEEEQRAFVDKEAQQYLRQQGYGDEKSGVPKLYTDIAYRMFNNERRANKGKTDQENWSQARQKLGQLLEHEAEGAIKGRPMLPVLPGTKNAVKQTKAWTEDYLKMAGNTPEVREKAKSILMNGGWSRYMATEFVQPMTPELDSQFQKLPKLVKERPGPQGQVPMGTVKSNEKKMETIQASVPELAKAIGDTNSLYLLRDNLVRKKGLNKIQADELIESIRKEKGGLLPHQSKDIPLLRESPQKDMWRIFYESVFGEKE